MTRTTMNIRNLDAAAARFIRVQCAERGITQAEYLERLVRLHEATVANGASGPGKRLLVQCGLEAVGEVS